MWKLRGYRWDWREFTGLVRRPRRGLEPAPPATVTGYSPHWPRLGAKVGTMSCQLSAIRFVHKNQPGPQPAMPASLAPR